MTAGTKPSRRARKAALEAEIEQQRLDLLVAAERWRAAARPLDAGWQAIRRRRGAALAGAGLLLWWGLRRPARLKRLGRGALLAALTARRLNAWRPHR
ncbi:YqjK family protein [Halomonas koreensis]|uniref:YqjK family protein n=1 Tax=Halomonas koreensis TaxID=245385 RepID=A0ABU1G597_9GAMM|nr:YqjK family protein [Halomonas koreensis]MDR5868065.1 YqjK family protein [Halomonas koreensis]